MPQFAANISTMFVEWAFPDRITAAANAGFRAIECQWPYDYEARDLATRITDSGVELVLMNAPKDSDRYDGFGMAAIPGLESEFRKSIELAAEYSVSLKCEKIHVMAGVPAEDSDFHRCRETFIENIRWAADQLAPHDISVMLEAINTRTMPGYHVCGSDGLSTVISGVERYNVSMQYDVFHSYRQNEKIIEKLRRHWDVIGHVQVSGHPGRHEPLDGDIQFSEIFEYLDKNTYTGWVGCEYTPAGATLDGLVWMDGYLSTDR